MAEESTQYIHALRFRWLNNFYDPVVRFTTRERTVKRLLVEQVPSGSGKLLDIGSGSGTLTREIKFSQCEYLVTGVDGDKDMLSRAERHAEAAGLAISYDHGLAQDLPYAQETFNVVTSSLFFHHLTSTDKKRAFAEAYRVMKPGGTLLIADWGRAQNWLMRAVFTLVQCLDGFETTRDNVEGRLPALLCGAGFIGVVVIYDIATPLGTISLLKASK